MGLGHRIHQVPARHGSRQRQQLPSCMMVWLPYGFECKSLCAERVKWKAGGLPYAHAMWTAWACACMLYGRPSTQSRCAPRLQHGTFARPQVVQEQSKPSLVKQPRSHTPDESKRVSVSHSTHCKVIGCCEGLGSNVGSCEVMDLVLHVSRGCSRSFEQRLMYGTG